MTGNAELAAAAKRLDDLAAELDRRGFAARAGEWREVADVGAEPVHIEAR